jgi:hypothetical protein
MTDSSIDIGNQIGDRSAVLVDALGRPIPFEGDLCVWLDDDLNDREAPEGWVHLTTVREVCLTILGGRVVKLSLDNDLGDDEKFGQGYQVVKFLLALQGEAGIYRWPRDWLRIHSANRARMDAMTSNINSLPHRFGIQVKVTNEGSKRYFEFTPPEAD